MEIQHKELNFQLMVEASPIALILVNGFGKIAYLNKFAEKLFLYKKEELIGLDLSVLIPEKFRVKHLHFLTDYFNNLTSRQMGENLEMVALRKDNVEFPVEIGLNPIITDEETFVLTAVNNITESLKAREQFRLVVESAPSAMLLANERGEIVMINKQTETLFGYSSEELLGEKIELLLPKQMKEKHQSLRHTYHLNPQKRAMGAGRDLYAMHKDGTEIPVEIGLTPIEKDEGNFVLASIIDITERKKNEDAFRLYTKKIEDKNKELEQFTYITSHDLREPLNSIISIIGLLLEDEEYKTNKELFKMLNYISRSSLRLMDLISGLLDFSRLGRNAEITSINTKELVLFVLEDLEAAIKTSNSKISLGALPVINAYEVELRLLFQNLLSNAIKYRKTGVSPEIYVNAKEINGGWEFAIKDNGIGIPSNKKEKVFLLFQRLHGRNEYDGIGIGLAHCKKVVELHDGKIWVESELDKGSTFYFTILNK